MATLTRTPNLLSIVATLLTLGNYCLAGTADVVSSDGTTMTFEYQGDKLRMNTAQSPESYMVLRDGHVYMVSRANGQLMVIDANQAMGMFGNMIGAAAPDMVAGKVVSMEATGKMEQLAGINGEIYQLRYIDDKGTERQTELVLSPDDRAIAFSDALGSMARSLSKAAGQEFEDASNDMRKRLGELDMGVLRYGDDMHLSAISDQKIEASRFELPAEPTDLSAIGNLLGGAMSQGSGRSGGDEKSGDSTGSDEATKEDALGKALGKLFGN